VRFSLIENEERTRQALRGIKHMFAKGEIAGARDQGSEALLTK
jgi:hypothetical protein